MQTMDAVNIVIDKTQTKPLLFSFHHNSITLFQAVRALKKSTFIALGTFIPS